MADTYSAPDADDMSAKRTEKQLGSPSGGYACDPTEFSNPGQQLTHPPDRPVRSTPRGNPVETRQSGPAGGVPGIVHADPQAKVGGDGPSYRVRRPGGNPRVPDIARGRE